ncbi:MAG: VTT domain-containing protein, partial [Candidatus Cyclobacteriaceae bacterium M2_1C_046]
QPFDTDFTRYSGLSLPLLMALIAFSTLISEDLTCIGAGLMAARGFIGFWPATIACFLGILVGDMLLYLAGRWLGRPAIQKAPLKWLISEKDLKKSSQWFKAKGPAIILTSRFLPGSRLPTYFSAGVLGTGFWMFSLYFTAAALLWTPLLVGLSMIIGNELLQYFIIYQDYALWIFLAGVVLLLFIAKVIIPVFNYRGRRLLIGRIRRFRYWEFWPPYIIYFPVCCYVVYLSLKYKSLTVFTAANPAIPDGGFIGESKSNILNLFSSECDIPRYILLDSDWTEEQQIVAAQELIKNNRLDFPVVVKPNEGQRGAGVVIARHQDQLSIAIKNASYNLIIQEYVGGEEYVVFYYRYPVEQIGN